MGLIERPGWKTGRGVCGPGGKRGEAWSGPGVGHLQVGQRLLKGFGHAGKPPSSSASCAPELSGVPVRGRSCLAPCGHSSYDHSKLHAESMQSLYAQESRPTALQENSTGASLCVAAHLSNCIELPDGGRIASGSGSPLDRCSQHCSTNGAISGDASNAYTSHELPSPHASCAASGTSLYSCSVLHQFAPISMNTLRPPPHFRGLWPLAVVPMLGNTAGDAFEQ